MPEESSTLRSVNSVVICGVVTRMMTNAKKPMSAAVTAIIAPNSGGADTLQKVRKTLQATAPEDSAAFPGKADWAIIA